MWVFIILLSALVYRFRKYIFGWKWYWKVITKGMVKNSNRIYPHNKEMPNKSVASELYAVTFGEYQYKKHAQSLRETLWQKLKHLFLSQERIFCFSFADIDQDFWTQNEKVLLEKRGAGYWLWKPYFCDRVFQKMEYGDVLMYMDGGLELYDVSKIKSYIENCKKSKSGIFVFETIFRQESWTKGDVFAALEMPMTEHGKLPQHLAGFFFIQKRKSNEAFLKTWLEYGCRPGLIDDSPSKSPNHKDFIENRHDQSIFSLLAWREMAYIEPAIGLFDDAGRPFRRRPK